MKMDKINRLSGASVSAFLWRDVIIGVLLIGLWILVSNVFGLDQLLTNHYFDKTTESFHLAEQYHWFFTTLLHNDIKKVEVICLLVLPARLIYLATKRRFADMKSSGYLLLAMALALLVVDGIHATSPAACPRDLLQYGGDLPFVSPWDFFQGFHGHCWPSGHAAGGFCLLAFFFWLRVRRSLLAWPVLVGVLLLGSLMSWTQIVRGAHFLSHCNWSLMCCWLVTGLLACFWWRKSTVPT
jgi:membrane-associated PAP2 superfamily phosphatase